MWRVGQTEMVYGKSVTIQTIREEIESQAQCLAHRITRAAEEAGRQQALATTLRSHEVGSTRDSE